MFPHLLTKVPGPRSRALAAELKTYECRNVTFVSEGFPIFWKQAHGVNVWDVDENRYLDLTSGFGVASLGYTPSSVVKAIREQAGKLYHAMGDVHPTEEKVRLCQELSRWTYERWSQGKTKAKTLLTNSGSEAVEVALKTAYLGTGRPGVIAFSGSYHGLSYGALSTTGWPFFREPFKQQLPTFCEWVPFPDSQSYSFEGQESSSSCEQKTKECLTLLLEEGLSRPEGKQAVGAILVEPIQGRGGEVVPPDWFLPLLRQLADTFGVVLIFDEIFTGFYRTGPRFACDHWEVVPDMICLGKALTSGFPLGACVAPASLMDAWPLSQGEALHTSTFLGNPLGCRMALTALAAMEKGNLSEQVQQTGKFLHEALESLSIHEKGWGACRGRGLMQGIEVMDSLGVPAPRIAGAFVQAMLQRGVILLSGGVEGHTLSFTPPFGITKEEIQFAIDQLCEVAQKG